MSEKSEFDPATAYVLTLANEVTALENVGGKGASLARLAAAGLPVPDGFHVTTAAYNQYVAANHLQPAIRDALATAVPDRPDTFTTAANTIRNGGHDVWLR